MDERWKGWKLLLRCLPAAAKSLTSHLFHTHTQITGGSHIFSDEPPHRGTRTVWQRARRGNKKLEMIFNSRELLADFLWMDCCTPRASPGSGPTWFGQPGQTNAGPLSRMTSLTRFIDDQVEVLVSIRGTAGSGEMQNLHRHCSVCPWADVV